MKLEHTAYQIADPPAAARWYVEQDAGDTVAMLRDPWGLALQLVHRRDQMI